MPRSPFETAARRGSAGAGLLLALLMAAGWPVPGRTAAGLSGELVIQDARNWVVNSHDDTWSWENVVITHGPDTRITASKGHGARLAGGVVELNLSGAVHIEFGEARLDADTATMVFRDQELVSVQVRGSQAQFSHQLEGYSRRINGTADAISYESSSGNVRFSGNTFWTDGSKRMTTSVVNYNIRTGRATDDGDPETRGQIIIPLGNSRDRVPPPRQPDRSTAQ